MRRHAFRWLCVILLLLAFVLGPLSLDEVLAPTQYATSEIYRIKSVETGLGEETPAVLSTLTEVEALVDSGALIAITAAVVSVE